MKKIIFDDKKSPFESLKFLNNFDINKFKTNIYILINAFHNIEKDGNEIYTRSELYKDKKFIQYIDEKVTTENTPEKKLIAINNDIFIEDKNGLTVIKNNIEHYSGNQINIFSSNDLHNNVFRISVDESKTNHYLNITITKNNSYKYLTIHIDNNRIDIHSKVDNNTKSNFLKLKNTENVLSISKLIFNNNSHYYMDLKKSFLSTIEFVNDKLTNFTLKGNIHKLLSNNLNSEDYNNIISQLEDNSADKLYLLNNISDILTHIKDFDLLTKDKTSIKLSNIHDLLNECQKIIKTNDSLLFTYSEDYFNLIHNFTNSITIQNKLKDKIYENIQFKEIISFEEKKYSFVNIDNISNIWKETQKNLLENKNKTTLLIKN